MSPETLHQKRAAGADLLILDVRTEEELERARLEPCLHVPLHELPHSLDELRPHREREIVCLCHHGIRSASACHFLRSMGFVNVHNLEGGIHAYATEVDPSVPVY